MSDRPQIVHRRIEANGITFACDECGSGNDVALLLHGFPECRVSWRGQLPLLASLGWRAVAPDLRGYGDTTRLTDPAAYHLDHLSTDVAALFNALGARRRLLIGHDWGAVIAWIVATERVIALDALIVMNVPHPDVFRRVIRQSWKQRFRSWYILFFQLPWLPEKVLTLRGALVIAHLIAGTARNPDGFPPEVLAQYRKNALRPGAMTAMLNYYRANARAFLQSKQSNSVQTPTLMIWGEHDVALGLELTEGYDDLVDDFTLRRLPDASHWVQQDTPAIVNEVLADWLGRRGLASVLP